MVLSSAVLHEHVIAETKNAQEALVRVCIKMELLHGTGPVVAPSEHSKKIITSMPQKLKFLDHVGNYTIINEPSDSRSKVFRFTIALFHQDVDGSIILRWIFRKWEGIVETGWSWLRIGSGGGRL